MQKAFLCCIAICLFSIRIFSRRFEWLPHASLVEGNSRLDTLIQQLNLVFKRQRSWFLRSFFTLLLSWHIWFTGIRIILEKQLFHVAELFRGKNIWNIYAINSINFLEIALAIATPDVIMQGYRESRTRWVRLINCPKRWLATKVVYTQENLSLKKKNHQTKSKTVRIQSYPWETSFTSLVSRIVKECCLISSGTSAYAKE